MNTADMLHALGAGGFDVSLTSTEKNTWVLTLESQATGRLWRYSGTLEAVVVCAFDCQPSNA